MLDLLIHHAGESVELRIMQFVNAFR